MCYVAFLESQAQEFKGETWSENSRGQNCKTKVPKVHSLQERHGY